MMRRVYGDGFGCVRKCIGRRTMASFRSEEGLRESFEKNGFLKIEAFCDSREVRDMMNRMDELIERDFIIEDGGIASFRTDEKQVSAQGSDDYFLDSGTRSHLPESRLNERTNTHTHTHSGSNSFLCRTWGIGRVLRSFEGSKGQSVEQSGSRFTRCRRRVQGVLS